MLPIHTILHATDFSEQSGAAFRLACALANDYQAHLIVLHVVSPPVIVYGEGIVPPQAEDTLEFYRGKLHALEAINGVPIERVLVEGSAADEIVRIAAERNCDVIVMGTHGRSGFSRLLMGSVAEAVQRHATCPVVTVRLPFALEPKKDEPAAAEEMALQTAL